MRQVALPEALRPHVAVWLLDLDLRKAVPDAEWSVLRAEEVQRAQRFVRHADRVRFVATRAALRRLLAERLQRRPQDLRIVCGPHGKPRLAQACGSDSRLEFNVSHSGEHALVTISSRRAVGVDIEHCDPSVDVASLEQHVLSPWELRQDAARKLDFFERWVVKEALLKAGGIGLAGQMQQLSVDGPPTNEGRRYGVRCMEPLRPSLGAWALDAPKGYVAALAYETEEVSLRSCNE